jgi:hypothetical protein
VRNCKATNLSSVILAYNDPTLKISDTFPRGKIEIRRFLCGLGCCTTFTSTPHFYSYFSVSFLWIFFFFMHKTKSKADNEETVAQWARRNERMNQLFA